MVLNLILLSKSLNLLFLVTLTNKLLFVGEPLFAQINNSPPTAPTSNPIRLPRVIPRNTPPDNFEEKLPQSPPTSPELMPTESPNLDSSPNNNVDNTLIQVKYFQFTGNTVFSTEELEKIEILLGDKTTTIGNINSQKLSYNQLIEIATKVADFYNQKGYATSGAIAKVPNQNETNSNQEIVITIQVLEGILEAIYIRENNREQPGKLANYIRKRLGVRVDQPLNIPNLLQSLQLLQIDPLVKSINAQLATGSERTKSIISQENGIYFSIQYFPFAD